MRRSIIKKCKGQINIFQVKLLQFDIEPCMDSVYQTQEKIFVLLFIFLKSHN